MSPCDASESRARAWAAACSSWSPRRRASASAPESPKARRCVPVTTVLARTITRKTAAANTHTGTVPPRVETKPTSTSRTKPRGTAHDALTRVGNDLLMPATWRDVRRRDLMGALVHADDYP